MESRAERRRVFIWRRHPGPTGFLLLALAVTAVAVVVTLLVPGFVAALGGVFYSADIRHRLPAEAARKIADFDAEQQRRDAALQRIERELASSAPRDPGFASLLWQRDALAKAKREAAAPIAVIPFYLNPQMLLWPATITCLLWIAIIMTPARGLTFRTVVLSRKTLQLGAATYLLYEWPLWVRNLLPSNEGRVVYAYTNIDINPYSFAMQEVVILTFCLLLAAIWRQWSAYWLRVRRDDPGLRNVHDALAALTDPKAAAAFRDVFSHWVSCSALLALAFVPMTAFYWDLVGRYHDQRYLLSAILVHVLWGLTWIVLSLPLLNEWRIWDISRTYAMQQLALMGNSEDATRRLALLKEIQPVTGPSVIVAYAASGVSFVVPIVQAFVG